MTDRTPIRRALLSVWDKEGLVTLARGLADLGVALVSSGSTAAAVAEAGIDVTPVSEVTGFPEMLGGRVKTLHPAIHAGILADRRDAAHVEELARQGIEPFDLVVSNLYPFETAVARGVPFDEVVEQIDIGGPTLVRAAAKNFESVAIVVTPARYEAVLDELRREEGLTTPPSPRGSLGPKRAEATGFPNGCSWCWSAMASFATARTRTSGLPCIACPARRALRRTPGCSRARRCRSTTGSTPTPRSGWPHPFRLRPS